MWSKLNFGIFCLVLVISQAKGKPFFFGSEEEEQEEQREKGTFLRFISGLFGGGNDNDNGGSPGQGNGGYGHGSGGYNYGHGGYNNGGYDNGGHGQGGYGGYGNGGYGNGGHSAGGFGGGGNGFGGYGISGQGHGGHGNGAGNGGFHNGGFGNGGNVGNGGGYGNGGNGGSASVGGWGSDYTDGENVVHHLHTYEEVPQQLDQQYSNGGNHHSSYFPDGHNDGVGKYPAANNRPGGFQRPGRQQSPDGSIKEVLQNAVRMLSDAFKSTSEYVSHSAKDIQQEYHLE